AGAARRVVAPHVGAPRRPRRTGAATALVPLVAAPATARGGPAEQLAKLCDTYWQSYLVNHPVDATTLGVHRWDDRWEDITPAGRAAEQSRLEAMASQLAAIPDSALSTTDRITRSARQLELQNQLDQIHCNYEDWVVDPLDGPQVFFFNLPDLTRIASREDARHYVARCRGFSGYLDAHIANLRSGLSQGRV